MRVNINGKRALDGNSCLAFDESDRTRKKKMPRPKRMLCTIGESHHKPSNSSILIQSVFSDVKKGDSEGLQEDLIYTGPAVKNEEGHNLLHVAAATNKPYLVKYLLDLINPNTINDDGQTPAHLAAIQGHTAVLEILLSDVDINPDKRDLEGRTYRDLLAAPLFNAVLWSDKSLVRSLLKVGADPDYHTGELVQGLLARELKVTTARQLAVTLNRESVLAMFAKMPSGNPQESSGQDRFCHSFGGSQLAEDGICGPLRLNVKPAVNYVEGSDVYKVNSDTRGYVCILNYGSFKNHPDLQLKASQNDAQNLANVFSRMGYTGHIHSSLTAQETKEVLKMTQDMEMLEHVDCAIFIISSHSSNNDTFLTSDMKCLTINWLCNLFQDSECPQLKNKPKIFIFDFCYGYFNEHNSNSPSPVTIPRVEEPLQDMMCLYSSDCTFTPYSYTKDGSAFITSLCRTLAQRAHNSELLELYRQLLKEFRKTSPDSIPQLRNIGFLKKFYFNPTGNPRKVS